MKEYTVECGWLLELQIGTAGERMRSSLAKLTEELTWLHFCNYKEQSLLQQYFPLGKTTMCLNIIYIYIYYLKNL